MKIVLGLSLFFFFGCLDSRHKSDKQTLDFGSFTIETPKGWTRIKAQGIDSYIGEIAIDNTDTLHFDLGWYLNNLNEYEPTILDSSMISSIDTSLVNISEIIFVKNSRRVDPDKYKRIMFRGTQQTDTLPKLFFQDNLVLEQQAFT